MKLIMSPLWINHWWIKLRTKFQSLKIKPRWFSYRNFYTEWKFLFKWPNLMKNSLGLFYCKGLIRLSLVKSNVLHEIASLRSYQFDYTSTKYIEYLFEYEIDFLFDHMLWEKSWVDTQANKLKIFLKMCSVNLVF